MGALKAWLKAEHGVVVRSLPVATMPNWRRRYDRHSHRLFLSERLSPFDQLREVAMEAALIRMNVAIAAGVAALKLSSDEARRIAKFELARYAAHALMMPYQAFHAAAQRARYDIDVLKSRFGVSFEQAANRVTTLCRANLQGVPFFMLEVDVAGHRFRRAGAQGFPQQRFGGNCPKLSVHAAFSQPAQVLVEAVEMPGGAEFITISRTLEGPQGSFSERPRRTAILLGCDIGFRDEIVYGEALPVTGGKTPQPVSIPVGPSCRLCERSGCLARAEPPITRPLGLDEMVTGLSAFDFQ
jgi:predicted transcriptional regulator